MRVEVIGIDRLAKKLKPADLKEALNESCLLVENTAKENCPVASGQLRNSIASNVSGETGEVGTNVEYAPYVEYGTGVYNPGRLTPWSYQDASGEWHTTTGQKPQPFLVPALDSNRDKILNIFKEKVKEGLSK